MSKWPSLDEFIASQDLQPAFAHYESLSSECQQEQQHSISASSFISKYSHLVGPKGLNEHHSQALGSIIEEAFHMSEIFNQASRNRPFQSFMQAFQVKQGPIPGFDPSCLQSLSTAQASISAGGAAIEASNTSVLVERVGKKW